jgi:hypothetical protein
LLDPVARLRVPKVNQGERDADALDGVRLTVLPRQKVASLRCDLELVVLLVVCHVWRDHRVQVDERSHTILCPSLHSLLPVWVLLAIELPVPLEANTLLVLFRADPILHPDARHRNGVVLKISIPLIDLC